jgi:ATP-dependent Clp protease ATP-binding subunit ClpX
LFALDNVQLEITPEALNAIAKRALERRTGARGLRSILENALLDVMYEIPSITGVDKVVIDIDTIERQAQPKLFYQNTFLAQDLENAA